jgi:hypothetical protein
MTPIGRGILWILISRIVHLHHNAPIVTMLFKLNIILVRTDKNLQFYSDSPEIVSITTMSHKCLMLDFEIKHQHFENYVQK